MRSVIYIRTRRYVYTIPWSFLLQSAALALLWIFAFMWAC